MNKALVNIRILIPILSHAIGLEDESLISVVLESLRKVCMRGRGKKVTGSEGEVVLGGFSKRIRVIVLAQSLYCFVEQILIQYNVLFAQSLGASGTDIGMISLVSAITLFFSSPYVGRAIEEYSMKKIILLGLACDITAVFFFITANEWRLLIPAFALYLILFRQIAFADMIFVTFAPPQSRATLMGFSRVLWSTMMLLASPIAASIVTYFGGINARGIRPLYYVSLAFLLAIFLLVHVGLDDFYISGDRKRDGESRNLFREYLELFRAESHLKYWLIIRLFRMGSMVLARTFVPLWIVNVKGATAIMLGTLSAVSVICSILIQFPVGKLADKIGRKKTFILFSMFYCLGLIILIIAQSPEHLVLASILGISIGGLEGGGLGGAAAIPLMVMWWEAVPPASRGKLYGLEGMIMSVSRLFSLIGGVLWDWDFKILAILIPALIESLMIIPLVYRLPEKSKSDHYNSATNRPF